MSPHPVFLYLYMCMCPGGGRRGGEGLSFETVSHSNVEALRALRPSWASLGFRRSGGLASLVL